MQLQDRVQVETLARLADSTDDSHNSNEPQSFKFLFGDALVCSPCLLNAGAKDFQDDKA